MTSQESKRVAALTARWKRSRASRGYEPFEVLADVPLSLIFSSSKPTQFLFITKSTLLQRIHDDLHRFPPGWVIASRPGIPGAAHARAISTLAHQLELPIRFVGDISPFDLHVFLEYRRLLATEGARIEWAGIGPSWLDACGRLGPAVHARLELTSVEEKHRDQLVESVPALPALIGQRPWAILQAGAKITLESASGVAAYGPRIYRAIIRALRGMPR